MIGLLTLSIIFRVAEIRGRVRGYSKIQATFATVPLEKAKATSLWKNRLAQVKKYIR
jgi:hypothetical protein